MASKLVANEDPQKAVRKVNQQHSPVMIHLRRRDQLNGFVGLSAISPSRGAIDALVRPVPLDPDRIAAL